MQSGKNEDYFLCVNASKTHQDKMWLQKQSEGYDVQIIDESLSWAMVAVQGPNVFNLLQKVFPFVSFGDLKKFTFTFKQGFIFSNTGYTGEKGVEIYIPHLEAKKIWKQLICKGKELDIIPVGLGARDTLRLEYGYLLSGQDFDKSKSPLEAGLSWLISSKKDYIGKQAIQTKGVTDKLCLFMINQESMVPRTGCRVLSLDKKPIGTVTSGAKAPTLEKMIGMA